MKGVTRSVYFLFIYFFYNFDIQRTLLEENGTSCCLFDVKLKKYKYVVRALVIILGMPYNFGRSTVKVV